MGNSGAMATAGLNFLLGLWCLRASAAVTVDCPVATKQPDPRSRKSKRRGAKRRVTWGPPRALRQCWALVLRTKAGRCVHSASSLCNSGSFTPYVRTREPKQLPKSAENLSKVRRSANRLLVPLPRHPSVAGPANKSEQSSGRKSDCSHPKIDRPFDPFGNRHRSNVAALPTQRTMGSFQPPPPRLAKRLPRLTGALAVSRQLDRALPNFRLARHTTAMRI